METNALSPSSAVLSLLQNTINTSMEMAEKRLIVQVQGQIEAQNSEVRANVMSEVAVDVYA